MIELSETAEIQLSGTFRFHALSASLQSDAGLSSLPLSDYQTAYLDVFGANDPQFVNFSFGFPSSLYVGYSSASIGVGNSGGLVGLGTSDPTDIRVFRGDWDHSSSIGTTFVGAYLLTIDGNQVSPNFRVEIIEVIPESSTTLLGGIGVLGLLHYRRRL